MVKIRALSFDADGCLFHDASVVRAKKGNLVERSVLIEHYIKENKRFLERLNVETAGFEKTVVFIGSFRQCPYSDVTNMRHVSRLSFFSFIKRFSDELGALFDPLLLLDIYKEMGCGQAYGQAMAMLETESHDLDSSYARAHLGRPQWIVDKSKITILYAQMHHVATHYSSDEDSIEMSFYDDKIEILSSLQAFFSAYPVLMPSHLVLRLYQYKGLGVSLITVIYGTGGIDTDYTATVREIPQIVGLEETKIKGYQTMGLKVGSQLTPEKLAEKKRERLAPEGVGPFVAAVPSLETMAPLCTGAGGHDERRKGLTLFSLAPMDEIFSRADKRLKTEEISIDKGVESALSPLLQSDTAVGAVSHDDAVAVVSTKKM